MLSKIRTLLAPGDSLLLGIDLVKDVTVLEAAYNDDAGVTAAFSRNHTVRHQQRPPRGL